MIHKSISVSNGCKDLFGSYLYSERLALAQLGEGEVIRSVSGLVERRELDMAHLQEASAVLWIGQIQQVGCGHMKNPLA